MNPQEVKNNQYKTKTKQKQIKNSKSAICDLEGYHNTEKFINYTTEIKLYYINRNITLINLFSNKETPDEEILKHSKIILC